jgi:hypothetical protein
MRAITVVGGGIAGVMAAPGLLSGVSFHSAIDASRRALQWQQTRRRRPHRLRTHAAPSTTAAQASTGAMTDDSP